MKVMPINLSILFKCMMWRLLKKLLYEVGKKKNVPRDQYFFFFYSNRILSMAFISFYL